MKPITNRVSGNHSEHGGVTACTAGKFPSYGWYKIYRVIIHKSKVQIPDIGNNGIVIR